jgi:hypothetical protein
MHGPAASAPVVSNKYCTCKVCHAQWQLQMGSEDNPGCNFCGAPPLAVTVHSEAPTFGGYTVVQTGL